MNSQTSAISYISANNNSPILANILNTQAKKLTGIVYPLVKQLAKVNFCSFINYDMAVEKMCNLMTITEINSCINYFKGSEFKKSKLYCQDWGSNKFYKGMIKEGEDMIYHIESPVITPKLGRFISSCLNLNRFDMIAMFNLFVLESCYLIGDEIIKEEIRRGHYSSLQYFNSDDYRMDYYGNIVRDSFNYKEWSTENCNYFKACVSRFDGLGRHVPTEYSDRETPNSSDEWIIHPTFVEEASTSFYDMFCKDKDFAKALKSYYLTRIRKTQDSMKASEIATLMDSMYEAYIGRLWGFEVPEH